MKHQKIWSLVLAGTLMLAPAQSFAIPIFNEWKTPEDKEADIQKYIQNYYKDVVTDVQLNEAQLKGMFNSLDPYSNYYNKEEFKDLNESLSGSFVGIGVHIEPYNGYLKVTKPIKGGPAEKAGIATGDVITKVDGKSISGLPTESAVKMIKGAEGTKVKVTVLKGVSGKEVTLELTRAVIKVEVVDSKMLKGNVGYVSMGEFDAGSASEVILAIKKLEAQKAGKIILDLRDNPGGYLSEAISLAEYFLPEKAEIMRIDYRSGEDEIVLDQTGMADLPMVVLVNANSASASEIVAAALQKNKRAKIVGETSYGKGTVQDVVRLPEGDGFKLTIAEYKGPNNTKINGIGVKPDYVVKANDKEQAKAFEGLAPMFEDKTYKAGNYGLNVFGAQQRLNLMGQTLKLTSKMDTPTIKALKSYQQANKLVASGNLDIATKKSLEEKTNQLYNRITSDIQLEKALEVLKAL